MSVVWAWVLIVAIAVGLPSAAWWLSRDLKPSGQGPGPPGFSHLDRWLAMRYQLSAVERWQVVAAVLGDVRGLSEPRLREAAHGVAAELMSGRLQRPWLMRWGGWLLMGFGLAVTALGLVAHFVTHRWGELGGIYLAEGPAGVVLAAWAIVWAPKQMRRKLERVMRLNAGHANSRSSTP